MLTTREIATVIWFVPMAVLVWWKMPRVRELIATLVSISLQPVFLVPSAVFAAWMVAVIYVFAHLGAWDSSRLKDTIYWVVPGIILMFGATKAAAEPGFFRRRVRDPVALSVFLGFYLGFVTLDLPWELVLVPVVTFLSLYATLGGVKLGGTTPVSKQVGNRAALIAGVIVIGLLVYATVRLAQDPAAIDWHDLLTGLALPVWLTLGALPYVWTMSLLFVYESAFSHMRIATTEGRVPWKSRLALITTFRFRRTALHKFAGRWPRELVMAGGFREARTVIAQQQAEVSAEAARRQQAAEDLKRYARATGLDTRGRQLDKREFKETVEALEFVAGAHVGWYQSSANRYRRDLMDKFGEVFARGLPVEHGITMKVSGSGQSWYAWRRTPSGLCFGIGAAGPPPDRRFFEGMDPPRGFPKVSPDWLPPRQQGPNWEWVYDPDASGSPDQKDDEPVA